MHHGLDPKIAAALERIAETTAAALDEHRAQQSAAVDGVQADIAALRTVEESAVTLILGIAEQQGEGERPTPEDIATLATGLRAAVETVKGADPKDPKDPVDPVDPVDPAGVAVAEP